MKVVEVEKLEKLADAMVLPSFVAAVKELIHSCEHHEIRSPAEVEQLRKTFEQRAQMPMNPLLPLLAKEKFLNARDEADRKMFLCDWFLCKNNNFDPPSDKAEEVDPHA